MTHDAALRVDPQHEFPTLPWVIPTGSCRPRRHRIQAAASTRRSPPTRSIAPAGPWGKLYYGFLHKTAERGRWSLRWRRSPGRSATSALPLLVVALRPTQPLGRAEPPSLQAAGGPPRRSATSATAAAMPPETAPAGMKGWDRAPAVIPRRPPTSRVQLLVPATASQGTDILENDLYVMVYYPRPTARPHPAQGAARRDEVHGKSLRDDVGILSPLREKVAAKRSDEGSTEPFQFGFRQANLPEKPPARPPSSVDCVSRRLLLPQGKKELSRHLYRPGVTPNAAGA